MREGDGLDRGKGNGSGVLENRNEMRKYLLSFESVHFLA
jgi:hypothetical protein